MATFNLQAIISRNLNNASTQFDRLASISSNVMNYNTNGYKANTFDQVLTETGYITSTTRRLDSTGSFMQTENPFSAAIKGNGFVPVTTKDGEIAYIRDLSFKIGEGGYLTTTDGSLVSDGIKIPPNYDNFRIKPDGTVTVSLNSESPETVIGKIPIVVFENQQALEQGDGNKFYRTQESGEVLLVKNHEKFAQGFIERSNVDIFENVSDMLRLNAAMISSFRMLKMTDDMYSKAINLRQ